MSQALRDLPDPMEPPPALAASSPDDLLSKMADEAIDKLMAEADKGASAAPAPPPPPAEPVTAQDLPIAHGPVTPHFAAVVPAPATRSAEPAVSVPLPATEAPALAEAPHPVAGPPVQLPPVPAVAPVQQPPAELPPAPAADVQALLREAPASPSPLLWPLRVINAPFGFLSDGARRALGYIGVVTLVPAACAIAYVLYFKHHW